MNYRERILAAFHHEAPDRTPADGWFHDEVVKKLKAHFKTDSWDEIRDILGVAGWAYCEPWIDFPEYNAKATARPNGLPGKKAIWHDDRTYEDPWGVQYRLGESGWYEEWSTGPLVNAESVRDVELLRLPQPNQIREPENYAAKVQELKNRGLFVSAGVANPYKIAWLLRGMENVLADYLINEEMLAALYDRIYGLFGEMTKRMARAGVDMICVAGDIAMQDRIIMGPDAWRALDKPRLAKLIADCRAIKPDVFFFFHSDGNVTDLMDDLVEIGLNVINPIQPECMDPVDVKKRWGDRIVIHGGISLQRTLPFGSVADVKAEVTDLIRQCGYNGGLVMFPSNVIQPDTPVENVIACFQTALDLDVRKEFGA